MELEIVRRLDAEIIKKRDMLEFLKRHGTKTECEEIEQELCKLELQRQAAKIALKEQIRERVPDIKAAQVLILRYVSCEKFSLIASEMNLCERQVYKLQSSGLKRYKAAEASKIV